MALDDLIPQLSLAILDTLRANSITSTTINHDFDATVRANKGATIDINELKPMVVRDATPGSVNPAAGQSAIDSYVSNLTINYYKDVTFPFTDKMYHELDSGTHPEAVVKATEALVEEVERTLHLEMMAHAYQFVGTAGTTPFTAGNLTEATQAFRFLSSAKAGRTDRFIGLDPFAYAQALNIPVLQKANEHDTDETLVEGMIRRVVGFDWYQNQGFIPQVYNSPDPIVVDSAAVADASTILFDDGAGAIPGTLPLPGQSFTFAGHTQQYSVVSVTPQADDVAIRIAPRLQADVADGELVTYTITDSHTANFAYHRDAVWMASRLPANNVETPGSIIEIITDEISNMAFSYEIVREHHQTSFKLSSMWGFAIPRPQLLVKILGQA